MGQIMTKVLSPNAFREIFMITYMSRRGVTPYTMDLIPGGQLSSDDSPNVARQKFKVALQRQKQLDRALAEINRGTDDEKPTNSMRPCIIREFNYADQTLTTDENGNVIEFKWKDESRMAMLNRPSRTGFGNFDKLLTDSGKKDSIQIGDMAVSSEEIVSYDVIKNEKQKEPLRGSAKEKRARSRPEPRSRRMTPSAIGQRQSMSVTQVMKEPEPHLLTPLEEAPSYVVIQRSQVGGFRKSKKGWPSKDVVRNALKDPRTRPTSYFIARFRPGPNTAYVEIDYRFNKNTGKDSFQCSPGSLESLLSGEALAQYQKDKENNNLDEKESFFNNISMIFNNFEGRVWWNGYIAIIDGSIANRMNLKSLQMDPPAFVFDVNGLKHISATRNDTRLSFVGHNQEGGDGETAKQDKGIIKRNFVLRGRTEHELKQIEISHENGTTLVKILLPTLSGIPVSTKNSAAKVTTGCKKSDVSVAEHVEPGKV